MEEIIWKLYSPLTVCFHPKDERGIHLDDKSAIVSKEFDISPYEDSICKSIELDFGSGKDLADLIADDSEDEYNVHLKRKVQHIVPSVVNVDGKPMACATVSMCEPLTKEETARLCSFIEDEYACGWGEKFFNRGFFADDGVLSVCFCNCEHLDFVIDTRSATEQEKAMEQTSSQPQRPKMSLVSLNGNIFCILGEASELLHQVGQAEQAKEMEKRVAQTYNYYEALAIISEYVETELSGVVQADRKKPAREKSGEAR